MSVQNYGDCPPPASHLHCLHSPQRTDPWRLKFRPPSNPNPSPFSSSASVTFAEAPPRRPCSHTLSKKEVLNPSLGSIDSAGTIGYHEGNPADSRMRAAGKRRGIEVTSISRPIRPSDFIDFDLILAMDLQNRDDILSAYEKWRTKEPLPEDGPKKVKMMCSYCKRHKEMEVPDPYYGGPQGFEKVLDILEDACESLLDFILRENSHIAVS